MYMHRCVQLYLVPIPYDPNRVYMCLCLVSSKALGIEGPEYVYVQVRATVFGANLYDPNSVYMSLCLLSSKALGIEESEYDAK